MSKQDVAERLRKVKREFAAKRKELDKQFEKEQGEILKALVDDFSTKFGEAAKVLKAIPDAGSHIRKLAVVRKFLNTYAETSVTAKAKRAKTQRKGGGRKPAVTEEQIIDLLEREQRTDDIKAHFGWSDPTVSKYLKPLLAAKKVKVRKEGTAKFWIRA